MSVNKSITAHTEGKRWSVQSSRQEAKRNLEKKNEHPGKSTEPQTKLRPNAKIPESQLAKTSTKYSKFTGSQDIAAEKGKSKVGGPSTKTKMSHEPITRRASDPGLQQTMDQRSTHTKLKGRRASDFGPMTSLPIKGKRDDNIVSSSRTVPFKSDSGNTENDSYDQQPNFTDIHCLSCQRKGRKVIGHYYCHDCEIGLCEPCAKTHVTAVTMNRHSVSVITETFQVSPNQGPFPNLTQIGTIKLDKAICIKGSAFLPNGVFLIADYSNSKIRMFTGDYTRKHVASLNLQKENKWDENKPNPLDIADISTEMFAFTTTTVCIYIVSIGVSMLMKIERIITVIRFESNYGECLGLAYNSAEESLYVGCTSDREGTYFNIYGLDGVQRRTIRNTITDVPEYLVFGLGQRKLYSADSDSVTVYDVRDFSMIEQYTELQAQTRDIFVDKYGYLYTLALERRTFKCPGSIYRLEPEKGVTKVTALDDKPSSISYCPKSDTVAVTFHTSRIILLFKLVLRTYEKQYGNHLKRY